LIDIESGSIRFCL